MVVLHGRLVVVAQSQRVTGIDEEVIAQTDVLKVMDDRGKVAGQQVHWIGVARHQAPAVEKHMQSPEHVSGVGAAVIGVCSVALLHAMEKPGKVGQMQISSCTHEVARNGM